MKEAKKDLFATVAGGANAICITTNAEYDEDENGVARAFMGGGCAGVCSRRWPDTAVKLGYQLKRHEDNIPYAIGFLDRETNLIDFPLVNGVCPSYLTAGVDSGKYCLILSFPTIDDLIGGSKLDLIKNSAMELVKWADHFKMKYVVLPRPGVGIGGLSWQDVKPVIEPLLDDRFTIVSFEHEE